MRISRRHLRGRLEEMGDEPAPPADTYFARRLEERLLSTRRGPDLGPPTAVPRRAARAWQPMPVALAAAAAAAAVFVVLSLLPEPAPQPVYFEPGSTTTSLEPTTTTTLVPDPPFPFPTTTATSTTSTVPTTAFFGPSPTTSPSKPTTSGPTKPTSTTFKPTSTSQRPPPSSTTTRPESSQMVLSCAGGSPDGAPGIHCNWSESSSPSAYGYRLWRKVNDGQPAVTFQTKDRTIRRYLDRNVAVGASYTYLVEAVDRAGQVVASSAPVRVACC